MTKNNKERVFGRNEMHKHKLEKSRDKKEYSSHIPIFFGVLVAVVCFVLLTGTAWASNSTTTENGQILVDGEPFFPIGTSVALWGEPKSGEQINAVFTEMKAAGFNTVRDDFSISGDGHLTPRTERVYRLASDNDLKVMLLFRNQENRPEIYDEAVNTYKDSPAAFAWEVRDEPTPEMVPFCEWAYAKLKSLDQDHICYVTFSLASRNYHPDGTETWLDWALGDRYPIYWNQDPNDKYIKDVVNTFLDVYGAFGGKMPTGMWLQAMGPARGAYQDTPTLEQERYMTYAVIAKGVTGIMWYNYDHAIHEPGLWEDVKQVAGELNYLHDALAQGHPTETVSVAADGEVLTRFHKVGNKGYLIAVNNEKRVLGEVTFTSPYYIHTTKTLFESAPTKDVNGISFTDSFDYLGVHVYELTLEEEAVGTVSGTVTSTTGAPIEGVNVQADGYFNKTNSTGGYTITNISVGNYIVTVSKTGYQSQSQGNVVVLENQTTTVDFQLTEASDLVGLWHFDEGSETTAADSSVNNNHGTLTNMDPATDWVDGKIGKALEFDNVDDYVDCGNDPSLNITDKITIMGWIKPNAAGEGGPNAGVISKAQSGVDWSWQLRYNAPGGGNYMGFQFNGDPEGSTWVSVKQNLSPGEWYHIAGTFDGTDIKCYLSGVEKDTNQISAIKGGSSTLFIGQDGWDYIFNGTLDEVKIYRRALSADEIKADYEAGVTGTISGTVTNTTNAPISGATVTANGYSDPDGTDIYGDYTIPNVPVGTSYTVTASKTGYQRQSQSNIEVLEDKTTIVNFQLSQLLINNLNRYTAKSDFDNGVVVFSDRSYTVSSVPEGYQGLDWIQTQCDDKQSTGSDWLTFDVSEDVTVYVGYAESLIVDGHPEAPWLDDGTWLDTKEGFEIVDWEPMRFYVKTFKKGGVILGGNYGDSIPPRYVVLVAEAGLEDTTPPTTTYAITPTPNEAGWNDATPVVMTFFCSDTGGSGINYTNYSKTSETTGPWTTVNTATATGPDAENVTDISEDKFNVTVSDEGITTIWYYSVNNNATSETVKNLTVKIDTTPPASISDLQNITGTTWINWTWTNPTDADFNHTMVYLNGVLKKSTSNQYYNATGLIANTSYEIGTHTGDTYGNVNTTWVNQTAKTVNNLIPRYDVNEDGKVDILDITIVAVQHYGETTNLPYPRYDVNADGKVDDLDITIVEQHFGEITN